MSADQGRFNTTISPMPSNTPGRRKGSQESQRKKSENRKPKAERRPNTEGRKPAERLDVPSGCLECIGWVIRVLAQRLNKTTKAAAAAARENEFQRASWPAASAPGSSVQVRFTDISWRPGRVAERRQSKKVQPPQSQNQPGPSCCRMSLAETGPSVRGQGKPRRANPSSRSTGAPTRRPAKPHAAAG